MAVNYAALAQSGGGAGNTYDKITLTQMGGANAADVSQIGAHNTFTGNQTTTATSAFNHIGGESDFPAANGTEVNALAAADLSLDWQHPVTQIGSYNSYSITQNGSGLGAFGTSAFRPRRLPPRPKAWSGSIRHEGSHGWQTHVIEFFEISTAVLPLAEETAPTRSLIRSWFCRSMTDRL